MDPGHGRVAFGVYADDWVASRHDLADADQAGLRGSAPPAPQAGVRVDTDRRHFSPLRPPLVGSEASGPHGHGRAPKTYRLLPTILNPAVEDGLIPRNPYPIKGAGSDHTP